MVLVSGLLVSCGTSAFTDRTGSLVWRRCGGIECTTLSVPLDWSRPAAGRITLSLARRPADGHRIGRACSTNPGGPGGSGIELVQQAGDAFDRSILDRFDIVSWDPRGVGASAPAGCGPDLDYFYEVDRERRPTPRPRPRTPRSRSGSCADASARAEPAAPVRVDRRDGPRHGRDPRRDGRARRSTTSASRTARTSARCTPTRIPTRVRAMVLDGAIDPAASYDDTTIRPSRRASTHALDAFFAWCRDNNDCAFARGGDPTHRVRRPDDVDHRARPIPATVDGEHRDARHRARRTSVSRPRSTAARGARAGARSARR